MIFTSIFNIVIKLNYDSKFRKFPFNIYRWITLLRLRYIINKFKKSSPDLSCGLLIDFTNMAISDNSYNKLHGQRNGTAAYLVYESNNVKSSFIIDNNQIISGRLTNKATRQSIPCEFKYEIPHSEIEIYEHVKNIMNTYLDLFIERRFKK